MEFSYLNRRIPMTTTPSIYVASLSDYNNGILHGAWIPADQDETEIRSDIVDMLASSPTATSTDPAEEYAIHDYEWFGAWTISEYESIQLIASVGALGDRLEPFVGYATNVGTLSNDNFGELLAEFEDAYCGNYSNTQDFAEELVDELSLFENINDEFARRYFDYEAYARDLFMSDFFSVPASDDSIFVYHN
jgi:antirestriction protein